jgi:hypothetical protein
MDEREIILGCIAGRPKAQKALFDIYAPKLLVICLRYMNEVPRAQDTLQDAFVMEALKKKNILISSLGKGKLRMVTHLDYKEVMHTYVKESLLKMKF